MKGRFLFNCIMSLLHVSKAGYATTQREQTEFLSAPRSGKPLATPSSPPTPRTRKRRRPAFVHESVAAAPIWPVLLLLLALQRGDAAAAAHMIFSCSLTVGLLPLLHESSRRRLGTVRRTCCKATDMRERERGRARRGETYGNGDRRSLLAAAGGPSAGCFRPPGGSRLCACWTGGRALRGRGGRRGQPAPSARMPNATSLRPALSPRLCSASRPIQSARQSTGTHVHRFRTRRQ